MRNAAQNGLTQKLRRALIGPVARLRSTRDRALDAGAPKFAEGFYRLSDRIAYVPFRNEVIDLPEPVNFDSHNIDIVTDLAHYTGLSEERVREVLHRRQALSFRSEWWSTPRLLRQDHWFYLSSKSYLFANAVHFPDTTFVDRFVVPFVPRGGSVLDFGGGAGGLTLMLATRGLRAWYSDVNALQRDFVRYRVHRHGLQTQITVIDWWDELPLHHFDAIVAVDVLEHLADAFTAVERLLGGLRPDGVLVENSPFVTTAANPMHHRDFGLRALLAERGFELVLSGEEGTCVWRADGGA
jgi:2-polyprenyl-3-methyl-5-hydroxy-6-metoxy-1,4-benzoquinol methylase